MGQIIKFPVQPSKFGYKRVPKRTRNPEDPAQLPLFTQPTAQVLRLATGLSLFEHALLLDEREDPTAAEFYQKAIAEQDCVADAYCNLGIIESKQGNTARAFDCFTNSLKHNPRHCEAHFNLGNVYFDINDFRLAQMHYEMAAEVDPSFPNVYFNLALVLSINNDLATAVRALTTYQELSSASDARKADEMLDVLRKSLAATAKSRA
jgi:Flp pilus assembly protein TadD